MKVSKQIITSNLNKSALLTYINESCSNFELNLFLNRAINLNVETDEFTYLCYEVYHIYQAK